MTLFYMVVTNERTSPVHVPRRDLVMGMADSLNLAVTIVETDSVGAPPLGLAGVNPPALQMIIWPDVYYRSSWDYGAPCHCPQSVLWSGFGTIIDAAAGQYAIMFPTATMATWPRRCAYVLQLTWDEEGFPGTVGTGCSMLAEGRLQLVRSAAGSSP